MGISSRLMIRLTTFTSVLVFSSHIFAGSPESDSSEIVTGIVVEGNRVTKEYVIRREIQHPVGVPFDSVTAVEDRDRIDNLQIFGEVQYSVIPNGDGSSTLTYHVVESWRVFPVPVVLYQEDTGWSFGGAVMVKNFRGRNETFEAAAAGGGTTFGALRFLNPWITGDHVSLLVQGYQGSYDHPFLEFVYREVDGEVTLGRYFGYERRLWITASLEKRRVEYADKDQTDIVHRYFQSKIVFLYDTRDVYLDPSRGILIYNEVRPDIGLDASSPPNVYWDSQISVYRTVIPGLHRWVAAGSFFLHTYFGESIPYRIMMIGGAKSVRGWPVLDSEMYQKDTFRAGLNLWWTSFELRQTVIPKRLIAPRTEFGLILAEFVDLGAADDKFFNMFSTGPISGVGVGLRCFIPGAFLFRIDYGLGFHKGEWQQSQWHIDMGHKF